MILNKTILETALQCAEQGAKTDEVPVGAVIFHSQTNKIISSAFNKTETQKNPLAHAEILAIQKACFLLDTKRLNGYSLFVTLEPCAMCAGALSLARLDAVYFGAYDPKTGAICQGAKVFEHSQTHHKPKIYGGIKSEKCGLLLTNFFQGKRK